MNKAKAKATAQVLRNAARIMERGEHVTPGQIQAKRRKEAIAIADLTSGVFDNGRRGEPLPGCDCERCFGYCLIDQDKAAREGATQAFSGQRGTPQDGTPQDGKPLEFAS